jgi:hypothetical protein
VSIERIDTFNYDPFGRRIEKISPTTTSVFAYDGEALIEETNATGSVVARYTQAGGPAFEAVLTFRVAHLSRRVTGGDFDFDSRIEESM